MSRLSRPISIDEMVEVFKSRHSTSHLLRIDNFSLLKKNHIKSIESSVFVLGGHKWKLIVYPKGNDENACGYVSVFLENQTSINVKLEFQVFVVSQLEQKWHPTGKETFDVTSTKKRRGHKKLISHADLVAKGYLIGDCCMFGVKLFEPPSSAECFNLNAMSCSQKVNWVH